MFLPGYADIYNLVFPAQLTSVSDGNYSFTEQIFDPTTGDYLDFPNGRTGTAVEINGNTTAVPTFAWVRFRGMVSGAPFFEFEATGASSSGGTITDPTIIDPEIINPTISNATFTGGIQFPSVVTISNSNWTFDNSVSLNCSLNLAYEEEVTFGENLNDEQLTCVIIHEYAATEPGLSITGFIPYDQAKGEFHLLVNSGEYSFTLLNQSSASSASHRLYCSGDVDATLNPNDVVCLVYDPPTYGWFVFANFPAYTPQTLTLTSTPNNNVALSADVVVKVDNTSVGATAYITGFQPHDNTQHEKHTIQNTGPYTTTIQHLNGGSSSGNQVSCPGLVDAPVLAGNQCSILYSPDDAVWYLGDQYIPPTFVQPPLTSSVAQWVQYQVPYTSFTAAATTQSITVATFPAGTTIIDSVISCQTNWSGGGLTNFTISPVFTGIVPITFDYNCFSNTPGNQFVTAYQPVTVLNGTFVLTATANSAGANVNAATAGMLYIWLLQGTLPSPLT